MTALWNDGAAFSLPLKRKLVTALSILILPLVWVFRRRSPIGAGLALGGGLSNLWERLRRGAVYDYVQFPKLPKLGRYVWNLADLAILIGGLLLEPQHVLAHLIVGERFRVFKICRNVTALHDNQAVGELHDLVEVRRDQQHRDPGAGKLDELFADEFRRADVNAACGLVGKNEDGVVGELARDDDLLDVAAGEHADLLLS